MGAKSKKEKEVEKEIEKTVEDKVKEFFSGKKSSSKAFKSKPVKIFGELIGYAIFLLFLFVIFPILPFVTDDYSLWLPIAFWATTIGTFLKILKHATKSNTLARLFEIGNLLASLYSTYWLLVIFPVDFAEVGYGQIDFFFQILIYVVLAAIVLGIFVNFIRIFIPEKKKESKK